MSRHGLDPPAPGKADEPVLTAAALAGLLADDARLRCAAAVVLGASTAAEVAERAGLDARSAGVYVESDVNAILGQVHDDHAALRRYLVDEGLLERRDGFYWRAGGTFEV